jgi:hypothetical protein
VFQAIREAKPARLFIAADGARVDREGEAEKCEAVRKCVLENIDWDCEVKTLLREKNLGCGRGPATAISWFFSHVEEGIILEDDCLPHPDFFEYCYELLEKYRNNKNIAIISGDNFQDGKKYGDGSYYFTQYNNIWGWATWRRVWETYQFDVNLLDKKLMFKKINKKLKTVRERDLWKSVFKEFAYKERDIWDYQLNFHTWYHDMYSISPNVNLIKNIGFGENATHTLKEKAREVFFETGTILPLTHPEKMRIYDEADIYFFDNFCTPSSPLSRFVRKIYSIIPHVIIDKYRNLKKVIFSKLKK